MLPSNSLGFPFVTHIYRSSSKLAVKLTQECQQDPFQELNANAFEKMSVFLIVVRSVQGYQTLCFTNPKVTSPLLHYPVCKEFGHYAEKVLNILC